MLVRPTLDLLAPLLVVSFVIVRGGAGVARGAGRALAVYAFVYVAMMAPWWLHNYEKYDRFVRLNLGDGAVARVENNPVFAAVGFDWPRLTPVIRCHDDLEPLARNEAYRDEAVRFVLEDPLRYARMSLARFFRFWSPTLDQGEGFAPLHVNGAAVPMNLLLLVGTLVYAWSHLRHEWRRALPFVLLVGYFTAIHSATHAIPRYRVPIIPILALLTSVAVARSARDHLKVPPRPAHSSLDRPAAPS